MSKMFDNLKKLLTNPHTKFKIVKKQNSRQKKNIYFHNKKILKTNHHHAKLPQTQTHQEHPLDLHDQELPLGQPCCCHLPMP